MSYDALKADLIRLSTVRELTPDEKAVLEYLNSPNGDDPPEVVRQMHREYELLTKAGLLKLRSDLEPKSEKWSLVPLERFGDISVEELWEIVDWLNRDFDVRPPRGADMMPFADLKAWVVQQVQSEGVRRRWMEIEQRKEADRVAKLRRINVSGQRLRDITDMALTAIVLANDPPQVFVRSGHLTRIVYDEKGTPSIKIMSEAMVTHLLERCADFVKERNVGTKAKPEWEEVPIAPPDKVAEDLMQLYDWPLPALEGIIECPAILPDDTLITEPGYNPQTRLYYAPSPGLALTDVPETPTKYDVVKAVDLLNEIFCDFPFDSEASRTNCIAALMTAVLRPLFPGNALMALIDKPQAGTGASLAAEVIAIVATGRPAPMETPPTSEDEWRKKITSLLMQGRSVVVLDNIEGKLASASLAAVLTAELWQDRVLGRNETIAAPNNATWIGTGNNIQLGGDMPRRCYHIRMDAKVPRPYQRTAFRHPKLKEWVTENRGRILAAVLTLARAWIQAGRPKPQNVPIVGGFEDWRDTIGGILGHAGCKDFLGNLEQMYEETDIDTPQWERFLLRWHEIWGDKGVLLADVYQHLLNEASSAHVEYSEEVRLLDVLPDDILDAWESKKKSFVKTLGKALSSKNGVVFPNRLAVRKGGEYKRAVKWIVYTTR